MSTKCCLTTSLQLALGSEQVLHRKSARNMRPPVDLTKPCLGAHEAPLRPAIPLVRSLYASQTRRDREGGGGYLRQSRASVDVRMQCLYPYVHLLRIRVRGRHSLARPIRLISFRGGQHRPRLVRSSFPSRSVLAPGIAVQPGPFGSVVCVASALSVYVATASGQGKSVTGDGGQIRG